MITVNVKELTSTKEILDAARTTVWKDSTGKEPSDRFLHDIYRSEHSPIRDRLFVIEIENIPSWVATHFVRHHVGMTPYVSTLRSDRDCGQPKRDAEAPVKMRMTINAQGLIDMARKRLCNCASQETRNVMAMIKIKVEHLDPHLAMCMVPNCVYRGFCPEGNTACYSGRVRAREKYVEYQVNCTGEFR